MPKRLLTPNEVARYLHLDLETIYRWLIRGQLRGRKIGRVWRVHPRDLRALVQAGPAPAPKTPTPTQIERANAKRSAETEAHLKSVGCW